jgi:hypothetical protein
MNKPLHIVCLDAPAPPDYGGAIDMYYKIIALSKIWNIILHYFNYKKGRNVEALKPYCHSIYAYKRGSVLKGIFTSLPYIVHSRNNTSLTQRLKQDNHPIILEGIHCTGLLPYISPHRKVVIRMHNDEAEYYKQLSKTERSLLKKIWHQLESHRIKTFQAGLQKNLPMACVAYNDIGVLQSKYGFTNLHFIPSFTPWQTVKGLEGLGDYCLYQGNMEVSENNQVAIWLIMNIFSKIQIPLHIAGKGISPQLYDLAKEYPNIQLHNHPSAEAMNRLVKEAQINILPSLNNTGLKLKLLHALFHGRHCLTNTAGISGTAFSGAVAIADKPEDYIREIKRLFLKPFTEKDKENRVEIAHLYNNEKNAAALNALLQTSYQ